MRTRPFSLPILLLAALALIAASCGSDDEVETGATPDGDTTEPTQADTTTTDDTTADTAETTTTDTTTSTTTTSDADGDDEPVDGAGKLVIGLEEVEGVFIEGFEAGIRIEEPDGTVVASWLWTDVVEQFGDGSARAYYETVLEESVAAGTLVVLATVNVGIGPPPEIPDLTGEMDCRLKVDVPTDGQAVVEINFSGTSDCLRQVS